ncbi:sodium-coupled monocarboxylate transporter 1-like isoform X2 [Littorina saxatilis]|uniref:sodium-coupled monocarboxylate transporter 1-like isoform X2 n=1 Tax=Littorina saxatilis TaxID=31220 RepID=UPI0038B55425
MEEQRHLGVWDYVVFALMLVVSAGIGIFYGCRAKKLKTAKEFLMANHSMSVVPVAISILLSFLSAISVLGTPAEMYFNGTQYFMHSFGMMLACVITSQVIVPLIYPLNLTSGFEYLELRFNSKWARMTGTCIMIVLLIVFMGIASFAPSTALEAVTGFPTWVTIVIIVLVSTFYTALGGIKAVIWAEVFQGVVMLVGLLAIIIEGAIRVGGIDRVWQLNKYYGRIEFFDFNPNPEQRHSFWSLVVGGAIRWTCVFGFNQASVQRYCSLPSLKKAKLSLLLNVVGIAALLTLFCLTGIVIFAYYADQGCDPLTSKMISNPNQIVPFFVMEVLNFPGLPGLFIACLFSGSLNTVSSCLNAVAAVMWQDFLKPFLGHRLTEVQKTWVTKLLVLIFGGVGIGVAFLASGLEGTVLQATLSFAGAADGPILGLFLLGGLFPWANSYGAIVGGIVSLCLNIWISIGAYTLPRAPSVSGLAFPNSTCPDYNITSNITSSITSVTTMAMTTASNFSMDVSSTTTVASPQELSGLQLLYTVPYNILCC